MLTADRPETRLATRLAFLVAGFGVACWASLVPFAKERLQVDDGILGLLLLCLGVGRGSSGSALLGGPALIEAVGQDSDSYSRRHIRAVIASLP